MFRFFKKKRPRGPDFTHLDSREKVAAAFDAGELEQLYLLPPEFGGDDDPRNIIYVPVGVAEQKHHIDMNVIGAALEEASVSRYSASPTYQGASRIPNAIKVRAWDPGDFTAEIAIWGDALVGE